MTLTLTDYLQMTNKCSFGCSRQFVFVKMNPEGLDVVIVSKLSSHIVDQVTCIECCKYYIAPETATCGHTLCHGCWSGRRSCPYCSASINRQMLKLNIPLKTLTENVHTLVEAHEKLFNVKFNEFEMFVAQDNIQSDDPNKNVQDWLASSQNHFSAPALSSQQSLQDALPSVELSASNIQIHTHTKKTISPEKVVHAAQPQVDWDKIETLPDTEEICTKKNENIIGPMDLEPFFIDENEYTTENPRRSSRKRDSKSDPKVQKRELSGDKHSSKNSSSETEKKSLKSKQNWSNVKKMRKEFSKLNKINRNKLNVSIEMCKKAQNTITKNKPTTPVAASQQACYNIDENTPDLVIHNDTHVTTKPILVNENAPKMEDVLNTDNNKKRVLKDQHKLSDNTNTNSQSKKTCDDAGIEEVNNTPINENKSAEQTGSNIPILESNLLLNSVNSCVPNNDETRTPNLPFLKKSALHKQSTEDNCIKVTQNKISSTNLTSNTDDIEISIKIGNTITNIFIKKSQNDVQVKLNTDREIQTSLGPHALSTRNDVGCSPIKEITVQNLELNIEDENKVSISKSTGTKKNTASADTATVPFEITDSVERELSKVMEQGEPDKISTQNSCQSPNHYKTLKSLPIIIKTRENPNIISAEDMEYLNDIDIFDSGSVKGSCVQLLKNTKHMPSEILMPTAKNKKSQKHPDKRDRESNHDKEIPSSKKLKTDFTTQGKGPRTMGSQKEIEDFANDSEHMTYDALMGQVFANIDADIQNSKNNNTKKLTPSTIVEDKIPKTQIEFSQIIHKTQHKVARKDTSIAIETKNVPKDIVNAKYSENVFSLLEKNSEPLSALEKNKQLLEFGSTQQRIENLMTPGMCRDLASTDRNFETDKINNVEMLELELGTPLMEHDDSDKSVVEETPQKNTSFIKPKPKTTETKQLDSQTENKLSDPAITRSVINISDTSEESRRIKDTTIVEINKRKPSLETPLTINKFVNHIKHNSTPVVRKSLNFDSMPLEDLEQTLCPTTTQEKEFVAKAFEQTPTSPVKKPLSLRNAMNKETTKYCVAGSCLAASELANVKLLCRSRGWDYVDKYSQDLTHLVVGVDEENKSQRSVKYMCALAASKWIISYGWIEQCLKKNEVVEETPYEALDACGDPGPRRSRLAQTKLFEGITFYCMPPFSVLELETLKHMLEISGGRIVNDPQSVRVSPGDRAPALLLAEPEHTQEDRFIYMAMELSIVPVNYEWALNCLGSYSLGSIYELLLCPASLLPAATTQWPAALMLREGDDD